MNGTAQNQAALQYQQEVEGLQRRLDLEREELARLEENAQQIDREYRRQQHSLQLKERELVSPSQSTSLNATQISLISNQRQLELDEERSMKKRFRELEEKIRITLQEKEEAEGKLMDFSKLLKETKESCEHAEMVVR